MSRKFLLDTNILVHLLRGSYGVAERITQIGWNKCCISEITMIELLYGAEISKNRKQNLEKIEQLFNDIEIIPISICIREFCREKARLRSLGQLIEDFDLFIGCTAISTNCILVTENTNHLSRLQSITLENWVERDSN